MSVPTPPGGNGSVRLILMETADGQVLLNKEIEPRNGVETALLVETLVSIADPSLIPVGEVIDGPQPYLKVVLTNYRPSMAPVHQTAGARNAIRMLETV
jgi:hypothetical protein